MSERMYENYKKNIVNSLQDKFKYKNVMEIPKIDKVVINMGLGEAVKDSPGIGALKGLTPTSSNWFCFSLSAIMFYTSLLCLLYSLVV